MKQKNRDIPENTNITMGDAIMLALWSIYGSVFNKWTLGIVYW